MAGPSTAMPAMDLMETLMKDPIKKALVLQLLSKEKDNLENYRRQELKKVTTPIKNNKMHCESPTALHRRRALEQRMNDTTSESSSSDLSEAAKKDAGPKLPFGQLLKGVRAYVEVRRDNDDRSDGIKAVMRLMGATVRDKFTNDVTHVIFKDGSFTTFEKAKLMKIHLVSVLWLDAVRRNNARVPERNYPAFGNRVCDANVSVLCSQIQKDYEEVIRDERRRRHTMMTSKTSMTSYLTAQNIASDDESVHKRGESPELTSDDSNCGVVDGPSSKPSKNLDILLQSNRASNARTDSYENLESSGSTSLLSHINKGKRRTVNITSDMVLTPDIVPTYRTKSSEKAIQSIPPTEKDTSKKVLQSSSMQSSTMSSLRVSTDSDKTKSNLGNSKESYKTKSSLVSGKENCSVTTANTSMSSLRLSDSLSKKPSEERARRSRSSTRLTPSSSNEKQNTPVCSISNTDNVTIRGRRRRKTKSPQPEECAKKVNNRSTSTSESEDESPKKRNASRSKSLNMSKSREQSANVFNELNQLNLELLEARGDSSKKKKVRQTPRSSKTKETSLDPSSPKRVQGLFDSSASDFDDEEQGKKLEISKRNRRATSFVPQTERCNRSRRSTSIMSTTSSISGTPRRSRRLSVASTNLESEVRETSEDDIEPDLIQPENAKKTRRASSVASSRSGRSSNELRRSTSKDKTSMKASVVLTRVDVEVSIDTKGNKKSLKVAPSPAKKSRVDPSVKKTRKLYNPDDSITYAPPEEDKEREEYLKQKSQTSPDDVFINPNNIIGLVATKGRSNVSSSDLSDGGIDHGEDIALKKKTKDKKGKKQKEKAVARRNSADDEQRELLELLERATTAQTRHSERLSLTQTKPKYTFSSTKSDSISTSSLPITPIKRRSTLDFVCLTQSQQKRKLKLDHKRRTSIVCTKMHKQEVIDFENAVAKLGRYFVEEKVTGKTSHLVAGEPKRTINMLRAIARGCWILKHEWLLESQEAGRWLNEEDYELTEFSASVQQCRLQKEAFGPLYSMDIFKDCGYIYVGKSTSPKTADLKELISICRGRVTTVYRNASVVIGECLNREGITCVTELWVLDSILCNKMKAFKHYLLKPPGSPYV